MACAAYFQAKGWTPDNFKNRVPDFATAQNDVFSDGVGCINSNQSLCSNFCNSSTKNSATCYNCLSNPVSCPASNCRKQVVNCANTPSDQCCSVDLGSCCPHVKAAVECSNCISSAGENATLDTFLACYSSNAISTTVIIIIVVCSIVGVIIIISVIVITVRLRKKSDARDKLVSRLRKTGANKELVNQVSNLDYAQINPDIYKAVNTRLALEGSRPSTTVVDQQALVANSFDTSLFDI